MRDVLVAAPALDAIAHFFTYLCRRARAQKSSADRRTDTATPLVGLSSFRPLVFAWLSLHSRLSIPFQRLGMLRRVDGLAEEQCGDSLPLSKTRSAESPQSKSHHLSCRVLSILSHYSSGLGRGLVPLIRRTWFLRTRERRALSIWLVGCR